MPGQRDKASANRRFGHWGQYWSSGHLTSLPTEFRANYDGPVREFWSGQFEMLPDGGRVLDLCSGNGAVALLAAAYSRERGRSLRITAVDAAPLHPEAACSRHRDQASLFDDIRFRSESPVETLDSESEAFDLVTSQYGVEYCDWAPAARQVARVLRPGGRFVFVSHATSSDLFTHMAVIEQEYARLDELGFFPAIRAFLLKKISFQRFNRVLRRVEAVVTELQARDRSPFLAAVLDMLREVIPKSKAELRADQQRLRDFYREFTAARTRQDEMLAVNRRLSEDPGWHRVFTDAGLVLEQTGQIAYPAGSGRRTMEAGDFCCFGKPVMENS